MEFELLLCGTTSIGIAEVIPPQGVSIKMTERESVRALLGQMLGLDHPLPYEHHPNGAPYLPHPEAPHISISHTRSHVAVALDYTEAIGIDIERWGDKVSRVATKFICPEEEEFISQTEAERLCALHLLWSGKESLFKLLNPSSYSLKSFTLNGAISLASSGNYPVVYGEETAEIYEVKFWCREAFVLTLAKGTKP